MSLSDLPITSALLHKLRHDLGARVRRKAKGVKSRYKTTNRAEYNAALKDRGSLTIWLDKDMRGTYRPAANVDASAASPAPPSSSA